MKRILLLIFCSFWSSSHAQTINGKVIDATFNKDIIGAIVQLFDTNSSLLDETISDEKGRFIFKDIPFGIYNIKVDYIVYEDTTFTNVILSNDNLLILDIHRFCQFDKSIKNKTCPYCNKQSEVIPIEYGLRVSSNGENLMKNEGVTFKAGGCNVSLCQPHWYCKRDGMEF